MKIFEKVLEARIRQIVELDEMQFGFTPGRGTTDAIFIVRQLQERFRAKRRPLYCVFVDLEKANDRVPREVVRWAMRDARLEEWLVGTVMCMYREARTTVQTDLYVNFLILQNVKSCHLLVTIFNSIIYFIYLFKIIYRVLVY